MILSGLQIGALCSIVLYFGWWRFAAHRRSGRTWEQMLSDLHGNWTARGLSEHFPYKEGLSASPDHIWKLMGGPAGLWAMYKNARVMIEMADYAAHNGNVDAALLMALRTDATQIRICALRSLIQYAINQASESVRIEAFAVASRYTGMAARMTQLLQDAGSPALPAFVAAL